MSLLELCGEEANVCSLASPSVLWCQHMERMTNKPSSSRCEGMRHMKFWGQRLVAKGQPVGSARGWAGCGGRARQG